MRLFTGLTVAAAAKAQCSLDQEPSSGCPDGWTAGATKCYKFVLKRLALNQALCKFSIQNSCRDKGILV